MKNLGLKFGAADQIRTDDLLHGKQTLYQLSYNRVLFDYIISDHRNLSIANFDKNE